VNALPSSESPPAPVRGTQSAAVVARDELLRRRIGDALCSAGIVLVDEAAEPAALSEQVRDASVIVVSGGSRAIERKRLVRAAHSRFPATSVIVISPASAAGSHEALEAGAGGVVLESQIEATLAATVSAVSAGQVVVPPRLRHQAARSSLSSREKQVLALVVRGLTNQQIAGRLFLAESTVKTHLSSVFRKLGVASRSDAAALVLDPDQKLGLRILGLSPAELVAPGIPEGPA
jgi:DNA-binding NarL/FixJ family response regulator